MGQFRLTIFQQEWWLKIARGSARLKEVQVQDANGIVVSSLTYVVYHNMLGIPLGSGSWLSRVSGPIVCDNLSDEEKIVVLTQLLKKLPNMSFGFSIREHTPNAHLIRQAFKNAGFECFEQINYSQPPRAGINRLGPKLRKHIKQAYNKLDIISIDSDEFINFYQTNLDESKKKCNFSLKVARELIAISVAREPSQARIIAATRKRPEHTFEQSAIDAAICLVWDDERCYYWLSTHRKKSHPDAVKLLIVEAMKHASKLGLIFDADDVSTPGSQRLFGTIFNMPNEERRYIFTYTSRLSRLYETQRANLDKIKRLGEALGLPSY